MVRVKGSKHGEAVIHLLRSVAGGGEGGKRDENIIDFIAYVTNNKQYS